MILNTHLFEIGDIVKTKSNGTHEIIGIDITMTVNETYIKYKLMEFKDVLFYEEDLKLIKRGLHYEKNKTNEIR